MGLFEVDGMNLITGGRLIAHRDPVRELLGAEECGGPC
jgi:hypothetical protein